MMRVVVNHVMLLADHRVRQSAMFAILSVFLASVSLSAAIVGADDRVMPWFLAGLSLGCAIPTLVGLIMIVAHTRRRLDAEQVLRETAEKIADIINRELGRRGPDYEAVLRPGEGLIIRHRALGGQPPYQPPPPSRIH